MKSTKRWFLAVAFVMAAAPLMAVLNSAGIFGKTNMLSDMEEGFKETDKNSQKGVNSLEEAAVIADFTPKLPDAIPGAYTQDRLSVVGDTKAIKIEYSTQDDKKLVILQKKASEEFKPSAIAAIGKVDGNTVEIQCPVQDEEGVLQDSGVYAGAAGISSVRWQQEGCEYAVIGNTTFEDIAAFIKALTKAETVELALEDRWFEKPQIEVPVDVKAEELEQKNADAGHSLWRLDPVSTAQLFVNLKISPKGNAADYTVKDEEINLIQNTGMEAVVEITSSKTKIKRVYLKKLVRQDNTGIWTVIGYD